MADLDHTIVCSTDRKTAIAFYRDVLGFDHAGRTGRFEVVKINDRLAFDFVEAEKCSSRHFAFVLQPDEFDETFSRVQMSGTAFGDGPSSHTNGRGPGRSTGTRGVTWSVYFADPDGHLLEILTYERPRSAGSG
jgi:catechol 2,3-dioxygenase-like lactoylglutathione lyase family enzyme